MKITTENGFAVLFLNLCCHHLFVRRYKLATVVVFPQADAEVSEWPVYKNASKK